MNWKVKIPFALARMAWAEHLKKIADKNYEKKALFSAEDIDNWLLENLKDEKKSSSRTNLIRNLLKSMRDVEAEKKDSVVKPKVMQITVRDDGSAEKYIGDVNVIGVEKRGKSYFYFVPLDMAQTELTAKLCKELADRKPFDSVYLPKEDEETLVTELFEEFGGRAEFHIRQRKDVEVKVDAAVKSLYLVRAKEFDDQLVPTSRVKIEEEYLRFLGNPKLVEKS